MGLFSILAISEILMLAVIRQHYYNISKSRFYITNFFNALLTIWLWIIYFKTEHYKSFYDDPEHACLLMNLSAAIAGIVFPRIVTILLHFAGKLIRIKSGGHIRWLTNAGLAFVVLLLTTISVGVIHGRFNFKTEEVTINIDGLSDDLNGLRIVQISDMHLNTFYHHKKKLVQVMEEINRLKPDLLINTGDFVSFGWREFERDDTILSLAGGKYGNYAILGNHDAGTYNPDLNESGREYNVYELSNFLRESGYSVLNDEHTVVNIGKARIGLIGVLTKGRHPKMIHGDLTKAMQGLDSVDFKILLSHDPNHWQEKVTGKTDIELTLSGHTHGMQMGILTRNFRWSPSKYFYPNWNGLYKEGKQFQYVNRGLGTLVVPFRIWMPPEISVITIRKKTL